MMRRDAARRARFMLIDAMRQVSSSFPYRHALYLAPGAQLEHSRSLYIANTATMAGAASHLYTQREHLTR